VGGQVRQQRDRLHRLAQPHLVRQYTVQPFFVQRDQPVQPLVLVLPQRRLHERRLLREEALAERRELSARTTTPVLLGAEGGQLALVQLLPASLSLA